MSKFLKRRRFITAGLATAAGASGVGAAVYFADRYGLIPPDHTGIIGIGETLTYATQRLVTSGHSLAREFKHSDISKVAPVNGPHPVDEKYRALLADGFKDWRLSVEGLVARPVSFSLEELKRLPAESHILLHACEEGWSTLPSGLACGWPLYWISSERVRSHDTSSSSHSRIRTKDERLCAYCGTASTWPMLFIRRRCSPMA
jgi:DMSO/TMAO reductase YedYZ molybdopterin-dependent catalytic subunit